MEEKILVIEDDDQIYGVIKDSLRELSFECERASDGLIGAEMAVRGGYRLLLLDLNLPGKEGTDVCKEIRLSDQRTPILVVSAREDTLTKALLLELGADDYITKPFDVLELKARVKAVLRRAEASKTSSDPEESFCVGDLKVDFQRYRVYLNESEVKLTPREYEVIAILARHPGRPLTRDQLNEEIYGYKTKGYELSINTHINRIRSKIEPQPANPIYVLTVRGVGYCMVSPDEFQPS